MKEKFTSFKEISEKYPINFITNIQSKEDSRLLWREENKSYYRTHDKTQIITKCIKYEYDGNFWYPIFKTEYTFQYEEC